MIDAYGKTPLEDIRDSLLVAIKRLAGQGTRAETLRWLLRQLSVRENPGRRGRPPEPSIDEKWSPDELRSRIIAAALDLANISDGRRRRSLLAALRHYRSEAAHKHAGRRGGRPEDRLALAVLVARYRRPGETNISAIASRIVEAGHYENQRKTEILVANIIGKRGRKSNKNKPEKIRQAGATKAKRR